MDKLTFEKTCKILDDRKVDESTRLLQEKIEFSISASIFWKNRSEFSKIFNDFSTKKINSDLFSRIIPGFTKTLAPADQEIRLNLIEKAKNGENLDIEFFELLKFLQNEKYEKMLDLFLDLLSACERLTFDLEIYKTGEGYNLNEEEFEIEVNNIISSLELYFHDL